MKVQVAGSREREFDLDPFRGLVCLWLMALHFCWISGIHDALLRLVGPAFADVTFHFRLGVESFLVLAGFMMAHMLRPVPGEEVWLGAYFKRRCYRLLLPFWIAILIAAADKWGVHYFLEGGRGRPDTTALLTQLLLINEYFAVPQPAIGYWSMATLEQFYLAWLGCLSLISWAVPESEGNRDGPSVGWIGAIAMAVFLVSWTAFLHFIPVEFHLAQYSLYIALGILLYGNARLHVNRWELRIAIICLIAAAIWFQNSRLAAAVVVTAILYAIARGAKFPKSTLFNVLRFVGRRSYSIYLIHAIVGIRVLSGYKFVARYGDWMAIPFLAAAVVASLLGAFVFYRLVEVPCQELARRVRYRSPTANTSEILEFQSARVQS